MRVPDPPRSWLVRGMPATVVGDAMRAGATRDPEYFDQLYAASEDPYGFDSNGVEQLKFERLAQVCGDDPFDRGLELGSAQGTFTERLAPLCRELVATDISAVAVQSASERLADVPGVRCEVRNLPEDMPAGPFDLIVASDVLYYWSAADVRAAVRKFEQALAPGGVLVAAHYLPWWGVILTGEEAHEILEESTTLRQTLKEQVEFGAGRPYRVDRYEKV
jgi:SAM-dependent methyltransferase